jgi:surface antigen
MPIAENQIFRPITLFALLSAALLTGCNSTDFYSKQDIGTVSGALIGGAIGSGFGKGEGQVAATVIGALAGGVIGNAIGADLDEEDRKEALNAEYQALEYTPAGSPVEWRNQTSGHYGSVTPGETYGVGEQNCRQYTHKIYIDGQPKTARGTACKEQDGTWRPFT